MPGGSLLGGLKARRAELLASVSTKDIPVPGWTEPALYLRIHPLDHTTLRQEGGRVTRAKGDAAKATKELSTSARVIDMATECVLIGEKGEGQAEVALDDPELLEELELEPGATALSILRALALGKDGVLLQLSAEVQKLSGYAELEVDEDFSGE